MLDINQNNKSNVHSYIILKYIYYCNSNLEFTTPVLGSHSILMLFFQ